jgi:hypothetical protein
MSRFFAILSVSTMLGLAAPVALADPPQDLAPRVESQDHHLAMYKKKGGSSRSGSRSGASSGAKNKPAPSRSAPARPAPAHSAPRHAATPSQPGAQSQPAAQRPAPQPSQPSQPAAQRPAPQPSQLSQPSQPSQPAAQRPAPQPSQPAVQRPHPQGAQSQPAAQRPVANPGQPSAASARPQTGAAQRPGGPAQHQGQIHSQGPAAKPGVSPTSARPSTHKPAQVHRTVSRSPADNIAGASRHAHKAQQQQQAGSQAHRNQHAKAHRERVERAHARARHAQIARHRHHAHARHAHRAYWARHHRHTHHWSWWHRPWWPRHAYYYGPWYQPYWSYGVFVYGPAPVHHVTYVSGEPQPSVEEAPERKVDRAHTWAVGIRGGSYMSGYERGPGYGDFGLGFSGRYRATESLGFELAWAHHNQTWTDDTERWSEPLSASVQLFAFPWTRFNPYMSAGITWTDRSYRDMYENRYGTQIVSEDSLIFGPHGGLGLEFGVGDRASINLEGRVIGYLNIDEDDKAVPSALQTTAGVNFYF